MPPPAAGDAPASAGVKDQLPGYAIIIEASLSFLGVGSPPDIPSWGTVLARTTEYHLKSAPWIGIFPGIAIFIVVMGFNLLGDALRDVFDPKLRGR